MPKIRLALLACLALVPITAFAHPGHGPLDFGAGLRHPLTGLDHLLAMLAVGWWSAASRERYWWLAPLAFAGGTLAGAFAGLGGFVLPAVDRLIAVSVLALGVLMLVRLSCSAAGAAALAAAFGLAHGCAHGQEMPATAAALPWLAGMVTATLALHVCGAGIGLLSRGAPWLTRVAGAAVGVAGLSLLVFA